jgi:tetratricopeptide (TPR) repeat protein
MRRALVCFLMSTVTVMAQHHGGGPVSERPVALYKGLGIWRRPIATGSPEAQKFFNQGLALLYGFNRYEALRSFRKAAELDPQAAMTYWGMAMAQGPYINMDGDPSYDLKEACAAVDAGLKVTSAPARDRAWLQAAATWCPEYRPAAYSDAMRSLVKRYPDDLDALTIYAESLMIPVRWHWYDRDGTAAPGMGEAEAALLEVLRRWPDHPGANHYYIHAVESSKTPERAIPSAQRLMGVVPWAGHMVHMPGHIWLVMGDWELAASLNERAAQVDREYFEASNVQGGTYAPYYLHNLHFILYARMMQGRRADALAAAATFLEAVVPLETGMPEVADMFAPAAIFAYARFGEWDRIVQMPAPKESMKASTAMWRYARTLALAAKGDRAGAVRERDAFETLRRSVPNDAPWGQNKAADVLALAAEILAARTAESAAAAVPHWRRAVAMQDAFVYDEPPAWYYPVRESLGAALLRAGNAAEAETVFREGVKRSPRNGRMLFGLVEALKAQSKMEDAGWVSREFEAVWAKSDVTLRAGEL